MVKFYLGSEICVLGVVGVLDMVEGLDDGVADVLAKVEAEELLTIVEVLLTVVAKVLLTVVAGVELDVVEVELDVVEVELDVVEVVLGRFDFGSLVVVVVSLDASKILKFFHCILELLKSR